MAKFSKIQVLQSMQQTGMIPVFYDENTQTAQSVLKACYEGGVRAFEFTNRGDFAIEVFKELINSPIYPIWSRFYRRSLSESGHCQSMQSPADTLYSRMWLRYRDRYCP